MGLTSLAASVGGSVDKARDLLLAYRRTFASYWSWVGNRIEHALAVGAITASFGWTMQMSERTNRRTLGNWPLQANGSEMLRLAILRAQALGIEVVAPVHDAILIHAPVDQLEHHIALATEAMQYASRQVLAGYALKVGVDRFEGRFYDAERDGGLWADIQTRMANYEAGHVG
jgi:DNA polymerase-1